MSVKRLWVVGLTALFASLVVVGLLSLLSSTSVRAAPNVRYVAPPPAGSDIGNNCTDSASPCATIQHAVDVAATGDEIRVAAGTYADIHVRTGITQVVYLTKTVTIRGGYTTTDWTTPDPATNPTVLDAQSGGRVIYIAGDISPTLEGLRITGGSAWVLQENRVGGGLYAITATVTLSDCHVYGGKAYYGGGVYVVSATATIYNCQIHDNIAGDGGGGVYLSGSGGTLSGNAISGNTSLWNGGGVYLTNSDAALSGNVITGNVAYYGGGVYLSGGGALSGNTIVSNTASRQGGGAYLDNSDGTLSGNTIVSNTASWDGGGAYLEDSDATLNDNAISANVTSRGGGGLFLHNSNATLTDNELSGNSAEYDGGGIEISYCDSVTLTGNTIISNTADGDGGGIFLTVSTAVLASNTLSGNSARTGGGVRLYNAGSATLTGNTISNNTALFASGGVDISFCGNVVLRGNTISGNGARYADGMYADGSNATLDNNLIADNEGEGVYVRGGSSLLLRHNTLARNAGAGVYLDGNSTAVLTNTILVSHTVGVSVTAGSKATLEATLWGSGVWANGMDWGGGGTVITGNIDVRAEPGFVNPDGGDYHLRSDSAAVDAGVDAGVTTDIDGQSRPYGDDYDIGADEYYPCTALTHVTIAGPITGTVGTAYVFTATVAPDNATLPIVYAWTPAPSSGSGSVVTYTWTAAGTYAITVTAENCGGPVTATHTITITAEGGGYSVYLPVVIRNR